MSLFKRPVKKECKDEIHGEMCTFTDKKFDEPTGAELFDADFTACIVELDLVNIWGDDIKIYVLG